MAFDLGNSGSFDWSGATTPLEGGSWDKGQGSFGSWDGNLDTNQFGTASSDKGKNFLENFIKGMNNNNKYRNKAEDEDKDKDKKDKPYGGDISGGGTQKVFDNFSVVYPQQHNAMYIPGTPPSENRGGLGGTLGRLGGTVLGGMVGGPLGATLGGTLGGYAGSQFG